MSANGTTAGTQFGNGAPSRPANGAAQTLNTADAVAYLEQYSRGDGLAVHELMDSRKNGGLTYNDFLMLPGKITFPANEVSLQTRYVCFGSVRAVGDSAETGWGAMLVVPVRGGKRSAGGRVNELLELKAASGSVGSAGLME